MVRIINCIFWLLLLFGHGVTYLYAQKPDAKFNASITTGCVPVLVKFTDESSNNPTSWFWDFGNGNTSTQQHPSAVYIMPGNYTVKLIVNNTSGTDSIIKVNFLTFYSPPTVNFTSDVQQGCAPFNVQFTDLSTDIDNTIISWIWDFGNGLTSFDNNPSTSYNLNGEYPITLIVTNDKGCKNYNVKNKYIDSRKPIAKYSSDSLGCFPNPQIDFTNTSSGKNLSYFWKFGDGGISSLKQPKHIYGSNGSYNAQLNITDDIGCTDSSSNTIKIVTFKSDFDFNVNCYPSSDSFSISFIDKTTPFSRQWIWDLGNGYTSNVQNPIHYYDSIKTYNFSLVSGLSAYCKDTTKKSYTGIKALFSMDVNSICQGSLTTQFTNLSKTSGALNYYWDFGDGSNATDSNTVHTFNLPSGVKRKTFVVTLTATDNYGCSDTYVDSVHIGNPLSNFMSNKITGCLPAIVQFQSTSSSFDSIVSYFWDFGDGFTATNKIVNHFFNNLNQYKYTITLIVTDKKGCKDTIIKPDYIFMGKKPDSMNVVIKGGECYNTIPGISNIPTDTTCYGNSYTFYGTALYNNPAITPSRYYWDFMVYPSSRKYFKLDTANTQNAGFNTGKIKTGYDTVMFVAGYNGCNDTIYKSFWNAPPVASFCPDVSLLSCSAPYKLSISQCSAEYGKIGYFYLQNLQTGQITDLDTSFGKPTSLNFSYAGRYNFHLQAINDNTRNGGCGDCAVTQLVIDSVVNKFTISQKTICLGNTIAFNDISQSFFGNIIAYSWDFGDGGFSLQKSPSYIYKKPGTFAVKSTITVEISNGVSKKLCYYSLSDTVQVNGPVVDFTADNLSGCIGSKINFTNLSTSNNSIIIIRWDFGDGSPIDFNINPSHTYNSSGNFTVTLTVTDASGCTSSLSKNLYIQITKPTAGFSASPTSVCLGTPVKFTSFSSGINLKYLWDFGDGSKDTIPAPNYLYKSTGAYSVKLVVTDKNGCKDSILFTNYITVIDIPVASFTVDSALGRCPPLPVNFINTSTGSPPLQYNWDFGDGSNSTLKDVFKLFSISGNYTIKLEVTNSLGCKNTYTMPQPISIVGPSGTFDFYPDSGCAPHTVFFKANTINTALYFWDLGDGTTKILTESDPGDTLSYTYIQQGNYMPFLFLKNEFDCPYIIPSNKEIFVYDLNAQMSVSDTIACTMDSIYFFSEAGDTSLPIIYFWDFGDDDTSGLKNPVHKFAEAGFYDVVLVVKTSFCTDTLRKSITIAPKPNVSISLNPDTKGCVPFSIKPSIITVPNTILSSWEWDWGDASTGSNLANPSHIYTTAGEYIINLTTGALAEVCLIKSNIIVTVKDPPVANFDISSIGKDCMRDNYFDFKNNSQLAEYYIWNFGNDTLSELNSPKYHYMDSGIYRVSLFAYNEIGCVDTLSKEIFAYDRNELFFIPNIFTPYPTSPGQNDYFVIRGLPPESELTVFNRWGEKMFESDNYQNDWDGGIAPTGVYYYVLRYCDNRVVTGFVHILKD